MKGTEERTEKIKLKGGYVCETFGPFVFLKKDESSSSSSSSLRTFLGADFASRVEDAGINVSDRESFRHVARETFEVESNWKVFIDNYLDGGFHVPFAHKALVKEGCDMSKYNITLFDNMNSIHSVDVRKEENTNSRLGLGSATYAFAFPNVCLNRYGRLARIPTWRSQILQTQISASSNSTGTSITPTTTRTTTKSYS